MSIETKHFPDGFIATPNLERADPINWSTLKHIQVSPKHYLHALQVERPDTEAMLLGRLTHCLVYEPKEVDRRYAVEPNFHKGMNDETAWAKGYDGGKQSAAHWAAEHVGIEIVSKALMERAAGMALALDRDTTAANLIQGGVAEQLIEWTDDKTGIECRGRVDHHGSILSDLKTTVDVAPSRFGAHAARFGYHAQLAYYADGLEANGVVLEGDPAIIAVESQAPHDVAVLTFTEEDMAAGRALYRSCLDRLAECRATGHWPGVAEGKPQRIQLPAWAFPQQPEITMGGLPIAV